MQTHGRILTPATLSAMLLTDRQLKGAGQCVVGGSSVDGAIDAYTQFLHRYALHVSMRFVVVVIIPRLKVESLLTVYPSFQFGINYIFLHFSQSISGPAVLVCHGW